MVAGTISFSLSVEAIDVETLRGSLNDSATGAYVSFEGRVRNTNEGKAVLGLEYEAYEAVALAEGERVIGEAFERFPVTEARCVHRVGSLEIGDVAVWIGVLAPHRDEAFAACRYIIDEVKSRVPIWKRERYASGEARWMDEESEEPHG